MEAAGSKLCCRSASNCGGEGGELTDKREAKGKTWQRSATYNASGERRRKEEGGAPVGDHDPGATTTGGVAMTQRWQVRWRVWEQWNPM
jgi:hypothetical protein